MKTIALRTVAALLAVALFGTVAQAGTVTVERTMGSLNGGEYLVTVVDAFPHYAAGTTFTTFGLESNEALFANGIRPYTTSLHLDVDVGGRGGPSPDPLDPMNAYLYTMYHRGALRDAAGNLFRSGDAAQDLIDVDDLQRALWYIEQEIDTGDGYQLSGDYLDFTPDYNRFVQVAWDAVHGPNATWSGLGDVQVLRMVSPFGRNAQDVAVILAPLPGAAIGGLVMLFGLAIIRTKRRTRVRLG